MKSIRGRMDADKPFAIPNGLQERFLASGRHGRIMVAAELGQIAGRIETEGIVFGDIFRCEHRAVLGKREFEVVLLAQRRQDFLRRARLALGLGNHIVLITGGLGEKENFLGGIVRRSRTTHYEKHGRQRAAANKIGEYGHSANTISPPIGTAKEKKDCLLSVEGISWQANIPRSSIANPPTYFGRNYLVETFAR